MPSHNTRANIPEEDYLLRLALCLVILLAVRLAAVHAATTDLVLDEAQYWTWSRALDFGYFSKPPMIAWVIRGASALRGDGEACVRSASPVLYTATSIVLYFIGRALYDPRVGFWSAIVFATLPGVSYSSLLSSVLCHSARRLLYAWVMLVKQRAWALPFRSRSPHQAGDDLCRPLHRLPCPS